MLQTSLCIITWTPCRSLFHRMCQMIIWDFLLSHQKKRFTFISHHCLLVLMRAFYTPLINWLGLSHLNTRIHVRLLGPCFKTGRLSSFRQYLWKGGSVWVLVSIHKRESTSYLSNPARTERDPQQEDRLFFRKGPFRLDLNTSVHKTGWKTLLPKRL